MHTPPEEDIFLHISQRVDWLQMDKPVKEVLHLLPKKAPKLACFVLHLKIINIYLKNNICIL